MKKIILIVLGLFLICPQLANAQSQRNPCAYGVGSNQSSQLGNCLAIGYYLAGVTGAPMPVGGIANASAPTFTEGLPGYLSFDLAGNLRTIGSSSLPAGAATAANQVATQAPVAPATATATKSDLTGCQATSAAINPTTGQQAAVDCDLNNNLLVSAGGAPNFSTSQVSVATSSTAVCAARALRRACTITAITGTQQIYCSGTVATSGNGQLIPAVAGASFTVDTTAAINCIALIGAQTVSIAETF